MVVQSLKILSQLLSLAEVLKHDINLWSRKSTEQYFSVELFINVLYQVVLTFESVDEILKCDHSNESYWAVLSCGAVYYGVQGGSKYYFA